MNTLTLLSTEWAGWIKSTGKFLSEYYIPVAIFIAILVITFVILNQCIPKKQKYEYLFCTGYISRRIDEMDTETETILRKDVPVKIDKETGMYYFQDIHKHWHKLHKKHRDQIDESRKTGTPWFDIPKKDKRSMMLKRELKKAEFV